MGTQREDATSGSFNEEFGWSNKTKALYQLYESIRLGFSGKIEDVRHDEFYHRIEGFVNSDLVPANLFLFGRTIDSVDYIVADELVFQALTNPHSPGFDKLALSAFNLSFASKRVGSTSDQIRRLSEFSNPRVEPWWVDALFLALDRLEDRKLDGAETPEPHYGAVLSRSGFHTVGGQSSLEKKLATKHLISLYIACGGRNRFSEERVKERTALKLPDLELFMFDDFRPVGAVHPNNPRIVKSIPRACAMLAQYVAGFGVVDADELATFDAEGFIRRQTKSALESLRDKNILPTMSAEELIKITRDL